MSQFGSQYHGPSKTKGSGNGKHKKKFMDKKKRNVGGYFSATKMADENVIKRIRTRGGNYSIVLKKVAYANLLTNSGIKKVKIKGVLESADNRNFARQNIITKGTVINTDLGKAIVTNSPGRDGIVNAKIKVD
ncbi:MAG: 30S ribosomal protein S8e [Candidatus Micrarchaeaceae archaeon]